MAHKHRATSRASRHSPVERWLLDRLKSTGLKWTKRSEYVLWQFERGVMIRIDPEPDLRIAVERPTPPGSATEPSWFRDRGVIVLRVRALDESDATDAVRAVGLTDSWNERRADLGLPGV